MASSRLDRVIRQRVDKVKQLKKLSIDPYPQASFDKTSTKEALKKDGLEVTVAGRLMTWRSHGKIHFADLQDQFGKIQLAFKANSLAKKDFSLLSLLDPGDFINVIGTTFTTKAGERTVEVKKFQLLSKAIRPLPSKWYGFKDVEERYRKRYLDMILNPDVAKRFIVRSDVIRYLREFLDNKGFIEVETPTLQPIYGGGLARPFITHHNALDSDFYLRISDEMYLKRLIVGGFEKVYEITKVFRNEGVDHDHNPEFTMFEAQIAFQDYQFGMDIIEEIIEHIAQKSLGTTQVKYQAHTLSFKRPWQRYRVVEVIKQFTSLNPLAWKTLAQAKKATRSLNLKPDKKKQLTKMNSIGEVIAFVFEEAVEEQLIQPTVIYDYPIEVSPLAKKCADPRFTQRFEMFAMGSELGNNYTELADPVDLKQRFIEEKKREAAGFKEAHQTDYDYLEAIEQGFPPTCGIAIGIDRLVMMLTDAQNIKEVIAFPTLKPKLKTKKKP